MSVIGALGGRRASAGLALLINVLLRIVALGWLAAGIAEWARIVEVLPVDGGTFLEAARPVQIAVGIFAIVDLLAAVGLWLLASWGTILWAAAILGQAASGVVFEAGAGMGVWVAGVNAIALVAYVVMSFMLIRIREREADQGA